MDLNLKNFFFGSDLSIEIIFIIMFIDIIIYILLILYLDQVFPGSDGPKQNVFFCLLKSYWFSSTPKAVPVDADVDPKHRPDIEEVSNEMKRRGVIRIQNISKMFKNTFAVNNLSLTIYESQITALLGHNGAGKTTLINMLLGSITPTSGTAYIYGKDVSKPSQMSELRSMFGVCLQENILFGELDSEEHLFFFGEMKGLSGQHLSEEVHRLLTDVELYQNRFTYAKDLSGGQKRKLCIAIALIASPKVVILDEPTSGVDIAIRRQIWTIIGSYKRDKTIIMTTHFMEEADIMSDIKAIISKGRLRCMGSSLFLKQKFGVGYYLTIALSREDLSDQQKKTIIKDMTALVSTQIQDSKFNRFIGSEVFYTLPQNQSKNFPKLFQDLDKRIITEKDVKTYGISMTSLEEVFLKLENEAEQEVNGNDKLNHKIPQPNNMNIIANRPHPTFHHSFVSYLWIKTIILIRNPWALILESSAIIFIIGIIYLIKMFTPAIKVEGPGILFTPDIYSKNQSVLKIQNKANLNLNEFNAIVNRFGVRTEAINDLSLSSLSNSYMSLTINRFEESATEWNWYFNETYIYALPILQNLMANTYMSFITKDNSRQIKTRLLPTIKSLDNQFEDFASNLSENLIMFFYILYLMCWTVGVSIHFLMEPIDDREV